MKKILIGCAAGSLLLTAGCSSAKHHFQYPESVTAEQVTNTYNLGYSLSVDAKENEVYIRVSLENPYDNEIPLMTDDEGNLFKIWVEDEEGKVIEQFSFEKGQREALAGKEKANWETTIDVNRDETVTVHSKVLLESTEQNQFVFEQQEQKVPVEVSTLQIATTSLNFTPREASDYIYETANEEKVIETFKYINGNRIQSYSKEDGVRIYSNEEDGLYVLSTNAATEDIDGTEYADISEMDLVIPYPAKEGYEWEINNKKYKVTDEEVRVKTPYKLFKEAVEVTETDKKGNKKYLYFHKDVGLVKAKQKNKKQLISKTIYELVDIKKRTGTIE